MCYTDFTSDNQSSIIQKWKMQCPQEDICHKSVFLNQVFCKGKPTERVEPSHDKSLSAIIGNQIESTFLWCVSAIL